MSCRYNDSQSRSDESSGRNMKITPSPNFLLHLYICRINLPSFFRLSAVMRWIHSMDYCTVNHIKWMPEVDWGNLRNLHFLFQEYTEISACICAFRAMGPNLFSFSSRGTPPAETEDREEATVKEIKESCLKMFLSLHTVLTNICPDIVLVSDTFQLTTN